jgi:DinB family protein
MRRLASGFIVIAVAIGVATARPAAQAAGSNKADIVKEWSAMKVRMGKLAEAMPEEKYGFKPTPEQRGFGEQMLHVAGANLAGVKFVNPQAGGPAVNLKATAKAEILKVLADSYDYGLAALHEQTDETLLQNVDAGFLGTSTRSRVFWALIGHAWDEYGVVTTYLRLNGIVPPASARPM